MQQGKAIADRWRWYLVAPAAFGLAVPLFVILHELAEVIAGAIAPDHHALATSMLGVIRAALEGWLFASVAAWIAPRRKQAAAAIMTVVLALVAISAALLYAHFADPGDFAAASLGLRVMVLLISATGRTILV